jgi:hypothetical protein
MPSYRFVYVAATLLLTSCVVVNTDKAAVKQAAASEVKEVRGALTGKRQMIAGFYNVNSACASGGYPTLKVLKGPEHGQVSVEQGVGYPNFGKDDPRSACAAKSFPGTELFYTSENGFTGSDSVTFERIGVSGGYARYEYTINVR